MASGLRTRVSPLTPPAPARKRSFQLLTGARRDLFSADVAAVEAALLEAAILEVAPRARARDFVVLCASGGVLALFPTFLVFFLFGA
jgi:hypothetical protein